MELFKVLKSDVKIRILSLLSSKPYPIALKEISDESGISKNLLRHHLKQLVDLGIVERIDKGLYRISKRYTHLLRELLSLLYVSPGLNRYVVCELGFYPIEQYINMLIGRDELLTYSRDIIDLISSYPRQYIDSETFLMYILSNKDGILPQYIKENYFIYPINIWKYKNGVDLLKCISQDIAIKEITKLFPDYIMKFMQAGQLKIDNNYGFLFADRVFLKSVDNYSLDYIKWYQLPYNNIKQLFTRTKLLPENIILKAFFSDVLNEVPTINNVIVDEWYLSISIDDNAKFRASQLNNFIKKYRGKRFFFVRNDYVAFPDGLYVQLNNEFIIFSKIDIHVDILSNISLLEEIIYRYDKYMYLKYQFFVNKIRKFPKIYWNVNIIGLSSRSLTEIENKHDILLEIIDKNVSTKNRYSYLISMIDDEKISITKFSKIFSKFNGVSPLRMELFAVDDLKMIFSYLTNASFPLILINNQL